MRTNPQIVFKAQYKQTYSTRIKPPLLWSTYEALVKGHSNLTDMSMLLLFI